jgi:hypothetical protein
MKDEITWPEWLPRSVRVAAIRVIEHRRLLGDPSPALRLALDKRMANVWGELLKYRRNGNHAVAHSSQAQKLPYDDEMYYPVCFHRCKYPCYRDDTHYTNAQCALAILYLSALDGSVVSPSARDELKELAQHYREQATRLREIRDEVKEIRLGDFPEAGSIERLVQFYELWAERCEQRVEHIAALVANETIRCRTDPDLRALVVILLRTTSRLFTMPLYGVVATIASVLLDREVSPSLVRSIARTLCT